MMGRVRNVEFANIGVLNKMTVLDAKPFMNSRVSEFNTFYIIANVCSTPREDLKKKSCVWLRSLLLSWQYASG